MNSKRKLLISMLAIVFVLLAVVATVAIAFALTQQTITTTLNIGYVVEDIDGTASATYTIGGVTERLTAMKGDQIIGDTLVFKAEDTEDAGNLMFPEGQIPLSAQNDNIVIQYTYSNTGAKHYIASMSFDGNISADNMKVEYSIDGTTYSENRYAVVVPANTSNKSYWIKISIENKAKSASFTGDFRWLLSGCDEQEDSYLSLTSLEFTGSNGSYSASMANTGSYIGELIFPKSVNGDPVTTISPSGDWDSSMWTYSSDINKQITSVYIPDSVETIADNAFYDFENLDTVTFEQNETAGASVQTSGGLQTIGSYAFGECSSLKNINLPDTLKTIKEYAFWSTALTEIIIPDSVTTLENYIFWSCANLTTIVIGDGVEVFANLFNGCTSLANVTLGSGLLELGIGSFDGCKNLTEIILPNNLVNIDSNAFYGTGLSSITIPASVSYIGQQAFGYCVNLKSLNVEAGNSSYHSSGNCIIQSDSKILIAGCKNSVIPTDGTVTIIGNGAFYGCKDLTSIIIPDCVTKIETEAFRMCSSITNLTLPTKLTTIGDSAFNTCSSLNSIIIPNSVTSLGEQAFAVCKGLNNVTIGSGITSIASAVFNNCTGLQYVTIPETVKTIANSAFSSCTGLLEITIPNSVTSIGSQAFYSCTGLTKLTIGSGLTSLNSSAFGRCLSLTEIEISAQNSTYHSAGNCIITTASKTLLTGCKASVVPTDGSVTKIGSGAFNFCQTLSSITIPRTITIIEKSAFSSCSNLTSVTFENPNGWVYATSASATSGTTLSSTDLANTSTAATYLKTTYCSKYWICK